ncbi:hypothetical protein ACJX0J_032720 [Zea mays]
MIINVSIHLNISYHYISAKGISGITAYIITGTQILLHNMLSELSFQLREDTRKIYNRTIRSMIKKIVASFQQIQSEGLYSKDATFFARSAQLNWLRVVTYQKSTNCHHGKNKHTRKIGVDSMHQ